MDAVPLVRVIRAGLEESVHTGDAAVVDAEGRLVALAGDPHRPVYARSSMKPLQAAVSLSNAPFDFTDAEVAVMCASHNGEPAHLRAVRAILARAGVDESALQTPSVRPWDDEALGADPSRRPINSDCSGKHAGMLAASVARGWPLETYRERDHPLQEAVLRAVLRGSGREEVHVGVDGCGVPVHGMPLRDMAQIYARLAAPDHLGDLEPSARRAVLAMRAEPYLVAGRSRPDTAVMQEAAGVIVKGGAEGLMCASLLERGIGVAVKLRDGGGGRASGPALIRALAALDVLDHDQLGRLSSFGRPLVVGGGWPVGELVAEFDLERAR
jgi:L-asparaginase II